MAGDPKRVVAYVKSDLFAKSVTECGKNWPAQEQGIYSFLREHSLRLPGVVMAGVICEERRDESFKLFTDALVIACEAEYAAIAGEGLAMGDSVKKVRAAATEAREAIQDHLDAMQL